MSRIVALAARGDGIADDGSFHAGAAPGDVVGADGGITAGPHRQAPPCRHFGRCGGCQLQHVDDIAYAGFITDRIASALAAQGLASPDISPPHLSPPHARRRVSMYALRHGESMRPSFTQAGSHHAVEVQECPVMRTDLEQLLKPLGRLLGKVGRGTRRVDIRMTIADQGVDLGLRHLSIEDLAGNEAMIEFAKTNKLARLSLDEGYGAAARWEPEAVTITLGGIAVPLPEGAFLQATADGEAALVTAVRETVGEAQAVADLFSGLGTFAFSLPGRIHAVEGAREAILALQQAANRAGRTISVEHRDLFRRPLMAAELTKFDAVVLDPPRAGAKEQSAELVASAVPKIAYVSCNPSTFARDAKMLVDGGYRLEHIQPVGQFRWSTHVELAARFSR